MAELTTLARPYAKAVFAEASEKKALDAWSEDLALLSAVSADVYAEGNRAPFSNVKTASTSAY